MPGATSSLVNIKKRKKTPKVHSYGLGDSDDFPAFDSGDPRYSSPKDRRWGFRITGGTDFKMPITVFQVTEFGLAHDKGIRLGDIILEINGTDATNLSLAEVHKIIDNTTYTLDLLIANMDEADNVKECGTRRVALRSKAPPKPIVEKKKPPVQSLERKPWHPVVWQQPPSLTTQENAPGKEPPHNRIIRNIKRFFKETEGTPEVRQKYVENMLLCLPGASKTLIQERLRAMQRRLSEIAEIPIIIQCTLETVAKTFGSILPPEGNELDENENNFIESVNTNEQDTDSNSASNDADFDEDYFTDNIFNDSSEYSEQEVIAQDSQSDNQSAEIDDDSGSDMQPNLVEDYEDDISKDVSENEIRKINKRQRIKQLEKCWPWADREKIIYKRSNCHLVPRMSIVENRVKQLTELNILKFQEEQRDVQNDA